MDKGNASNNDDKSRDRREYNRDNNRGKELDRDRSIQHNKNNQNNQNSQREPYKRDNPNFNRPPSVTSDKKDTLNISNDDYYTNKNNRKDINRDNRKSNYQSNFKDNDYKDPIDKDIKETPTNNQKKPDDSQNFTMIGSLKIIKKKNEDPNNDMDADKRRQTTAEKDKPQYQYQQNQSPYSQNQNRKLKDNENKNNKQQRANNKERDLNREKALNNELAGLYNSNTNYDKKEYSYLILWYFAHLNTLSYHN